VRLTLTLVTCAVALAAAAQTPPAAFDVASVKASPPLPPGGARVIAGSPEQGGRWVSQNAPFLDILRSVYPEYRLRGQITGGPDWVARTRFDIDARVQGGATRPQMVEMMKRLLAERFALKVHTEPREIDVYGLTMARSDGRLGPAMRPATVDCEAVAAARAKGEAPAGRGRPLCIALSEEGPNGIVHVWGDGAEIFHLISMIQGPVREPIVDRTGLTGRYDVDLEFNPELGSLRAGAATDLPGSSLFTAVEEQLGLRLQPQKAPMNVLVIDGAQMPTPD
jgi:uncharacterized protein (TIGR03435 family)